MSETFIPLAGVIGLTRGAFEIAQLHAHWLGSTECRAITFRWTSATDDLSRFCVFCPEWVSWA